MSTELGFIKHSGSRVVELQVTRYSGGIKNGMCLQLTGTTEEGYTGYVQLNKKDMLCLIKVWQKEIGALGLRKLSGHRLTNKWRRYR
jgi:hypothetical protein